MFSTLILLLLSPAVRPDIVRQPRRAPPVVHRGGAMGRAARGRAAAGESQGACLALLLLHPGVTR